MITYNNITKELSTSLNYYSKNLRKCYKQTILWIVVLLFTHITLTQVHAQTYSSIKIEELGSAIPADCLPSVDSIFNCPTLVKERSLVVNYNSNNEIIHLGISLFSNETKELLNLPVCNFIERMMLELILEETSEELIQKIDRSKMSISRNGVEFGNMNFTSLSNVLDEIQLPAQFSLMKEPDKFAAVWKYNQEDQLVFSFPASRDLIFGTDKKESDDILNKALFGSGKLCDENNTLSAINENIREADLTFNGEKNIFTKKGSEFILSILNSNTYYKKEKNVFELVFSKDFPEESFTNLILKNTVYLNHQLHVTHRMYGNFSPDFDVSLKEFLCFFHDDYDFFAAASRPEPQKLKLTVVMHSKDYNFIHLLMISSSLDNIFNQDGMLTAEFYSNIPQQSIRSLMGELISN